MLQTVRTPRYTPDRIAAVQDEHVRYLLARSSGPHGGRPEMARKDAACVVLLDRSAQGLKIATWKVGKVASSQWVALLSGILSPCRDPVASQPLKP